MMKTAGRKFMTLMLILCIPVMSISAPPGVTHKTKTEMKFHGFMSTMMKFAGGDKPKTSTVYVSGSKQRTDDFDKNGKEVESSSIVDLDKKIFIKVNHKKKEYTITSFDEWKENMERMKFSMPSGREEQSRDDEDEMSEVKVDFNIKVDRTGEKKRIAGYIAEQVVVTMKAEGKKDAATGQPDGKGGMKVTSKQWMSKGVQGYDEIKKFALKFSEELGMPFSGEGFAGAIKTLTASNPELANSIENLKEGSKDLEGFAVRTESIFETWGEPDVAMPPGGKGMKLPPGLGGIFGGFSKKKEKKGSDGNILFEVTTETLDYKYGVLAESLFEPPSGYKNK